MKLQHGIVLSVLLSLTTVMLIFGYAAADALRQAIDATFEARVVLARTVAGDLDASIGHSMEMLERTARLGTLDAEAGDPTNMRRILQATQYEMGTFAEVTLLDSRGRLVASAPDRPALLGEDMTFHPAAATAMKALQPAVAELPARSEGDVPMACLAVPLLTQSGDLSGALMAELDPRVPGFLVQPSQGGGATRIELFNPGGLVAASAVDDNTPLPDNHYPLLEGLIDTGRAGAVVHSFPDGYDHIVAYAPLTRLPSWGVAVEYPQSSVLALPAALAARLVLFGGIALVAAVLLAWVAVGRLTKPLSRLRVAAAQIGAGDLATPVDLPRGDEIGLLARTLEGMRKALQDSIGKRERYETELEQSVQQRTKEVVALLAASEAFASTLDLSELLQIILSESRRVCPSAEAGMVVLVEPRSGSLVPAASFGCDQERLSAVRWRSGEGVVGSVFAAGVATLLTAETIDPGEEGNTADGRWLLEDDCLCKRGVRAVLGVPLAARQAPVGILMLFEFREPATFSEGDRTVLQAIGSHAAMAVENARLYAEVRRKDTVRRRLLARVITAQEEERRRIARELHDEPAQALTAATLAVDAVEAIVPVIPEAEREQLAKAKALTQRALSEVRQIIWDLRPTVLDDLGLVSAVRWCAEQRLGAQDVRVQFSVSGLEERLPAHVETEVYRVLQEAISNTARHAHASQAWIRLGRGGTRLTAEVEDDGQGFDVADAEPEADGRGLGMVGMRERVELLGGTLSIHSNPGLGTRITIEVPVEKRGDTRWTGRKSSSSKTTV